MGVHFRPVYLLYTDKNDHKSVEQRMTWTPHGEVPAFVESIRAEYLKESGGTVAMISQEEYDAFRFRR